MAKAGFNCSYIHTPENVRSLYIVQSCYLRHGAHTKILLLPRTAKTLYAFACRDFAGGGGFIHYDKCFCVNISVWCIQTYLQHQTWNVESITQKQKSEKKSSYSACNVSDIPTYSLWIFQNNVRLSSTWAQLDIARGLAGKSLVNNCFNWCGHLCLLVELLQVMSGHLRVAVHVENGLQAL